MHSIPFSVPVSIPLLDVNLVSFTFFMYINLQAGVWLIVSWAICSIQEISVVPVAADAPSASEMADPSAFSSDVDLTVAKERPKRQIILAAILIGSLIGARRNRIANQNSNPGMVGQVPSRIRRISRVIFILNIIVTLLYILIICIYLWKGTGYKDTVMDFCYGFNVPLFNEIYLLSHLERPEPRDKLWTSFSNNTRLTATMTFVSTDRLLSVNILNISFEYVF